jgi:hypothetical protein
MPALGSALRRHGDSRVLLRAAACGVEHSFQWRTRSGFHAFPATFTLFRRRAAGLQAEKSLDFMFTRPGSFPAKKEVAGS